MARPKKKVSLKQFELTEQPLSPKKRVTYINAMVNLERLVKSNQQLDAVHQALQIIDAMPREETPRLLLLSSYLASHEIQLAGELVDEILLKFSNSAVAYRECSRYFLRINNTDKAIKLLHRAIKFKPLDTRGHLLLANTYTQVGEKDLAIKAFSQVIKLKPGDGSGHFGKAQLIKDKASEQYIGELEQLITNSKNNDENRLLLHFAAAWSYGEGSPDKYFKHLHAGNALVTKRSPWNKEKFIEQLKADREFLNEDQVRLSAGLGNKNKSPIFIASMPRSGTTLLEQILGSHSRTYPIGESGAFNYAAREVAFSTGVAPEVSKWKKGERFSTYLPLIDKRFMSHPLVVSGRDKVIVDKSMTNIAYTGLILLTYPNAKIIHLRRHPMDMIYSCYQQLFDSDSAQLSNLENLAALYQSNEIQMQHWKKLFPDNIVTIDYEKLVGDKEKQVRELLEFCELPWEDACLEHQLSVGTVQTASYMQVRQPVYKSSVGRWEKFSKYLQPAINVLGL